MEELRKGDIAAPESLHFGWTAEADRDPKQTSSRRLAPSTRAFWLLIKPGALGNHAFQWQGLRPLLEPANVSETGLERKEMDIEGPASPIRSLKDFAIHIATVTIGILIALGLEALIDAHHIHVLVEHARSDFRTEYSHNREVIVADLQRYPAVRAELEALISYGHAKLANRLASSPKLASTRAFVEVSATAWNTAVATQALVHLSFQEAGPISQAQTRQTSFNTLQSQAETQWFGLAAYGDPSTLPKAQIEPALEKVTVAYAYLVSVNDAEQKLRESYDAALGALQH